MPSDPPPTDVDGQSATPTVFRVFAVADREGPPEKMLKEFDQLSEAEAFARFVEKGGAFIQVRVEEVAVRRKKKVQERNYRGRPGEFTKLIFFVVLLLGLAGGLALGIILASTLGLRGKLFFYCAGGGTVAGAVPAYWVMNKLYGTP